MPEKPAILCVDDDHNVVESMTLNLRKTYRVLTAMSGAEGLDVLRREPDVAVVVSDMRMPEMDGAQFLAKVKVVAPSAVRVLLTGYSDIDAAMRAVNEGQIFRFLTKPCAPEHLFATLAAAVEQHRLVTAERVLLQKTLLGSVKAIVEIAAIGNPMALGRAVRVRDIVRQVGTRLGLEQLWRVEVAALLSQLGTVTLPDDTLCKIHYGEALDTDEQQRLADGVALVNRILRNIPRLEPVTNLLDQIMPPTEPATGSPTGVDLQLLKAALDMETIEAQGRSRAEALEILRGHEAIYGSDVLDAIDALQTAPDQLTTTTITINELQEGMTLCEDLKTTQGILILPRGFEINAASRGHVLNFASEISERIRVLVPADGGSTRRRAS